jgi:hypothetical protein
VLWFLNSDCLHEYVARYGLKWIFMYGDASAREVLKWKKVLERVKELW